MATNVKPYEIIAAPANVYVAATGVAFPGINTVMPTAGWSDLGKTEGGVMVRHTQSVEMLSSDQTIAPIKAIRSEESLEIEFALAELTLENYARVLNDATVTSTGGTEKKLQLYRGTVVNQFALLVRGPSPYGDFNLQYEVPVVVQTEEPEVSFVKDDKAVLSCVFSALDDHATTAADLGTLRARTA